MAQAPAENITFVTCFGVVGLWDHYFESGLVL